jgi:translocation and assembly module TamB
MVNAMDRDPDIAVSDIEVDAPRKGWRIWRWLAWIFGVLLILLLVAAAIIWWQRIPIATSVVDDELKKLGLPASYTIEKIGPQRQIIRNIVVGPKDRPDLTIDQAIVDLRWGWDGPYPVAVTSKGIRLRGDLRSGKLSFGSLDKLRNPDSKEPFRLPDIYADVRDVQISLTTEYGPIGAAFAGKGDLPSRFAGTVAIASKTLAAGGCTQKGCA